jgi:AcrR family transcriptional regulator
MPEGRSKPAPGPNPPRLPDTRPGPAGGKRDRNRRRKTRALLEAGLRLFLEHGIAGVTVDAIAKQAGVAKGSFYRYFQDTTELVEALLAPVAAPARQALSACRESLEAAEGDAAVATAYLGLGLELAAVFNDQPDVVRLYLQESRSPAAGARAPICALADEIAGAAIALSEQAIAHGLLRRVNPRVSALAVIGAAERLLYAHLAGEPVGDAGEVTGELVRITLEGLAPRHGAGG